MTDKDVADFHHLPEDVTYEHVLTYRVTAPCSCGASFNDVAFDLSVAQSNARFKLAEHDKGFHGG